MSNDNYYDYRWPDRTKDVKASTPTWMLGLIAGAALGSGLALLFAPRQGAATRHQLAERGQEAGRQVRHAYESVAGTARRNARRLTERAQYLRRHRPEAAAARDSIYADYGTSSTARPVGTTNVLRDGLHDTTHTSTPSSTAPGAASSADAGSPFA